MADTEQDPHGVCRGVIDGIMAAASQKLTRAIDRVEAALDDLYDVLDELDPDDEDER